MKKLLLPLLALLFLSSCFVTKERQTLTGRVIEKPVPSMKGGYKIRIITEKQNWTDTQYVFVNSRLYEVGKCYYFTY